MQHLSRDPLLASLVGRRPGLRAPGGWDGFELGVRAILGQQISVAAARSLAGELVARHGQAVSKACAVPREPLACISHGGTSRQGRIDWPTHSAGAPTGLEGVGGGRGKRSGLVSPVWKHRNIPREIAYDPREWASGQRNTSRLRALREMDAFPSSDIGLIRAAAKVDGTRSRPENLLSRAESWRPWRAYAAQHLWASDAAIGANAEGFHG